MNDLNTGRNNFSGAGNDNTSALAFGAESPPSAKAFTESWNGVSWVETSDLNTGRAKLGGDGASNSSALAFGGETPPVTTATEEWNVPSNVVKTLTD